MGRKIYLTALSFILLFVLTLGITRADKSIREIAANGAAPALSAEVESGILDVHLFGQNVCLDISPLEGVTKALKQAAQFALPTSGLIDSIKTVLVDGVLYLASEH